MANTEILQKILGNDLCAKWINLRDYAFDKLSANADIKAVMDEVDKYGYGEWVREDNVYQPKGNVPIMTSNTAPYGVASAYQVFDGSKSTTASGTDFSYQFTNPICVKDFICKTNAGVDISGGTLQASNDGTTWVVPTAGSFYLYYRVHFTSSKTVGTVQFYGREMKASVPYLMNQSNIDNIETAQGMVLGSAQTNASYKAAYVFKGDRRLYTYWSKSLPAYVGYKFKFPFVMKKLCIGHYSSSIASVKNGRLQASNNGTDWVNIMDVDDSVASKDSWFDVDNNNPYYYWRLYATDSYYSGQLLLGICQFFGFDYSERDWDTEHPMKYLYDHGVELENITLNGTATKEDHSLRLSDVNAQASKSLDTTDYDLLRSHVGQHASGTNTLIAGSGTATITTEMMPYLACLDISSVNGTNNTGVKQTAAGVFDAEELWLE